jgi:hypothetical protein
MLSPVRALLDASVLYSNHQRNLLLQLARNEVFVAKWSALIEDEWLRNVERPKRDRIEARTLPLIREYFPSALVSVSTPDRVIGKTNAKDRHVASAAVELTPSVLVTSNLKHFDAEALAALGVKVQSPDDFLTERFDESPAFVYAATREAAANLTRTAPPGTTISTSWRCRSECRNSSPVCAHGARNTTTADITSRTIATAPCAGQRRRPCRWRAGRSRRPADRGRG